MREAMPGYSCAAGRGEHSMGPAAPEFKTRPNAPDRRILTGLGEIEDSSNEVHHIGVPQCLNYLELQF